MIDSLRYCRNQLTATNARGVRIESITRAVPRIVKVERIEGSILCGLSIARISRVYLIQLIW